MLQASVAGPLVGGWLTGAIFDWTGSYTAAFFHGIGWNLLNMGIAVFLLQRSSRPFVFLPASRSAA